MPSALRACASWRQCSNSLSILGLPSKQNPSCLCFFLAFLYFLVIPDYERMAPVYFLDLYLLIIQIFLLSFSVSSFFSGV